MHITFMELFGVKYPLVFNNSAGDDICEEFGSIEKMREALASDNPFRAINKTAKILINNGIKYCQLAKIECPAELTFEPGDAMDMTDPAVVKTIFEAMNNDSKREVEVSEKNAVAKRSK